jgi:hypothetical protein
MQLTKKIELAQKTASLWARLMPDCPPPTPEHLMRWREQGAFALLTAITRTVDKWDAGDFDSPTDAHYYCGATCRNIALSTDRRNMRVEVSRG